MKLPSATYVVGLLLLASQPSSATLPDCVNGPLKSNKVCDVTASPADRASALVDAMESSEKLQNIVRYIMRNELIQRIKTDYVLANLQESRGLAYPLITGGVKHSMALLALLESHSRLRHHGTLLLPFPCPS